MNLGLGCFLAGMFSTMSDKLAAPPDELWVRRQGASLRITLQRPRAINALTEAMCRGVRHAIENVDSAVTAIIIDGAGERGLCGGGDIKRMAAHPGKGAAFLREEYLMDYAVSVSSVPVIALMDGVTMGGGVGISGHAALRVVSENTAIAMPEARIGLAPDVGGNDLLAQAPGFLGELYAVTAESFGAAEALEMGFADYFVPTSRREVLVAQIASGADPHSSIASLATAPDRPSTLDSFAKPWHDVMVSADEVYDEGGADSRAAALDRVLTKTAQKESATADFARQTLASMGEMCPTSLVVALEALKRVRTQRLSLKQVLENDYLVAPKLIARPDFQEGVRARLVDRDNVPKWNPASLHEVHAHKLLGPERSQYAQDSLFSSDT
jgi:enoyl-CoA hydratase